jgi:hypothetical protein
MVGHRAGMGEVHLVGEPDVARCATSVVGSKKRTSEGRNHARSVRARDQKIQKTAAEPIGVSFKAPNELTLPILSKPDPRLVALVRILAREAARDCIRAAWARQESAASPIREDF